MDLNKVESIKTIDTNDNECKIFVETVNLENLNPLVSRNQRERRRSNGRKKKKITIISKKTHRDGSVESVR